MKFYHGTTIENYQKILNEGCLFGKRYIVDEDGKKLKEVDRCTYLCTNLDEAKCYGNVVLEVEYEPTDPDKGDNNYFDTDCWQIRVYVPIYLDKIKRII